MASSATNRSGAKPLALPDEGFRDSLDRSGPERPSSLSLDVLSSDPLTTRQPRGPVTSDRSCSGSESDDRLPDTGSEAPLLGGICWFALEPAVHSLAQFCERKQ